MTSEQRSKIAQRAVIRRAETRGGKEALADMRANGGKARAKKLKPEERVAIAKRAGEAFAATKTPEEHARRMRQLRKLRWPKKRGRAA